MTDLKNIVDVDCDSPDRILIGGDLSFVDDLLGGGLIRGGTYLLTGQNNSGKTSISMQILNQLQKQKEKLLCIFHSSEMPMSQVKYFQRRMGLEVGFLVDAQKQEVVEDQDQAIKELFASIQDTEETALDVRLMLQFIELVRANKNKTCVLVIDSLQSISNGRASALDIAKRFKKLAEVLNAVVILIGQVTKGGAFAGYNELVHTVSAHIHIVVISNDDSDQSRLVKTDKNRFGPCKSVFTNLTEKGHVAILGEGLKAEDADDDGGEDEG